MKSMTGYARVQGKIAKVGTVAVTIRSVNGRFLDLRLHLGRELSSFESEARALVHRYIRRGTVDLSVAVLERKPVNGAWQLNEAAAHDWLRAARQLGRTLKMAGEPTLADALRVPDLLVSREREMVPEGDAKSLCPLVEKAIRLIDKERVREGAATANELKRHLHNLGKSLERIRHRRRQLEADVLARLKARVAETLAALGGAEEHDRGRLLHEAAFLVDRMDISEELERLQEHVKTFGSWLRADGIEGKKLDFYTQELLREINTIGSKSHDGVIAREVVTAKTEIERIREQVQNLE